MLSKLPFVLAITSTLLITGCNDDDPVNDSGIAAVEEFKIADFDKVSTVTGGLAGVWVAVGTGTFERDKSGDRKYGDQSAKIYFMITGDTGSYEYANCFSEGRLEGGLEGGFKRGGFDSLTVDGGIIKFDADRENGSETELISEDDDFENTGTVTNDSEINSVFIFDDGKSREVNTFVMYKVSNDLSTFIGDSTFETTGKVLGEDDITCFAQWSGSYRKTDGYYTVERFDASFNTATAPYTASEYSSDSEDITEYSSLSYDDGTSFNTKDSDSIVIDYSFAELYFSAGELGSSTEYKGLLDITHSKL